MSSNLMLIAILGIIAMIILLVCGVHIGFAMMLVGFVGYFIVTGNLNATLGILRQVPATTASSFNYVVIPLFILMGNAAFAAGVSDGLFDAGDKWLSRMPGGLAAASVASCAGFGAICGSAAATAATMGVVAIPKMRQYGYSDSLSAGSVASGGTLGILIPPSTPMIVYGIMAEVSIGRMFAAGIIPGIMLALIFIGTIVIYVLVKPGVAPSISRRFTMKERMKSLKGLLWVVVLFGVVLGSFFSGLFTVNEAAAAGALCAILIMIARRRMNWQNLKMVLRDTIKSSAMIYLILIGADVFGKYLAITQLPMNLANFIGGLNISKYVIMIIIILIYAILGCFMDALPMITLTVPIFLPVITNLGFDPVWFGILCIVVMELGFITPPVGLCCYVISGVIKDLSLSTVFKGCIIFIPSIILGAILILFFPQIVTWLPNLLFG